MLTWFRRLSRGRSVDSSHKRSGPAPVEALEPRCLLSAALVKDLTLTTAHSSDPNRLVDVNGTVFFAANGIGGQGLYRSDGTDAGTQRLLTGSVDGLTDVGGTLFFSRGDDLYKSDGTVAGTVLVKSIPTPYDRLGDLTEMNGRLYFTEVNDGAPPLRLWTSDGTAQGTVLVREIPEANYSPKRHHLFDFNGTLFFYAFTGLSEIQLWKSDGTPTGTERVKTWGPNQDISFAPSTMLEFDGRVVFRADSGPSTDMWVSDGTEAGTVPARDLYPALPVNATPLRAVGPDLYFTSGFDLWKTDGTQAGTMSVGRLGDGNRGAVTYTGASAGKFYIGEFRDTVGHELFTVDGNPPTMRVVKNIHPGTGFGFHGSFPDWLTDFNGQLYFAANDGTTGLELWRTDGTDAGTVLTADIHPTGGSGPSYLTNVRGTLFFQADTPTNGRELWKFTTSASAPLGLIATGVLPRRIDLQWGFPGTGATGFKIERSTDGVDFATVAVVNDPAARAHSDTNGLSPLTRYFYRVRAITTAGDSPPSGTDEAVTMDAIPAAPTNLAAAPVAGSTSSIRLTWMDNSPIETSYKIERRPVAAAGQEPAEWQELPTAAPANATSYADTGLPPSTAFEYRVRASNADGNSAYSNGASATTHTPQSPFGAAPLAVPGLIQAEDFDNGSNSIAYFDTSAGNGGGAGAYRGNTDVDVFPTTDRGGGHFVSMSSGEWLEYTVNVAASATYNLEARLGESFSTNWQVEVDGVLVAGPFGASPGTVQGFRTVTFAGILLTAGQHVLRLTANQVPVSMNWMRLLNAATVAVPSAPADAAAFPIGGPQVDVTWRDTANNETGFWIERKTPAASSWSRIGWSDSDTFRFTDTAPTAKAQYLYRVLATNSAGDSAASNEAAVTAHDAMAALVKDITLRDGGSDATNFVRLGDTIYFFTAPGGSTTKQLWKTDGTAGGTQLVAAALTGATSLTAVGNTLFFVASDATHGAELWKSDGTSQGTGLAVDVDPFNSSNPKNLTPFNNGVVFSTGGDRVYVSDGTSAGTTLLRQFTVAQPDPPEFTASGALMYFVARDAGSYGLWRTDGTAAGTYSILEPNPNTGNMPRRLTDVNGTLYFAASVAVGTTVYKSNGTAATTVALTAAGQLNSVFAIESYGGSVYFLASTGTGTLELWRTNGTPGGATAVTTIHPFGSTAMMRAIGGKLVILAHVGSLSSWQVWTSDGTAAGTTLVRTLPRMSSGGVPSNLMELNGAAVFTMPTHAGPQALWRTDGTDAGTAQAGYVLGTLGAAMGGRMYVSMLDSITGWEPYTTDGTRAGSTLLANLNTTAAVTSADSTWPRYLTDVNGTLFFAANPGAPSGDFRPEADLSKPSQLWRSDGTEAGTVPITGSVISPFHLHHFDGSLLFYAAIGQTYGLWRSDGTAAGTVLLKDLGVVLPRVGTIDTVQVTPMVRAGAHAYFVAAGQLWKTDGTADGTSMVKTLPPDAGSSAFDAVDANGTLYFTLSLQRVGMQESTSLWRSDGTEAGTVQVRAFQGAPSSFILPTSLTAIGGVVYFRAGEGSQNRRLWRSDGSDAGTFPVTTVDPTRITAVGGRLFYYGVDWTTNAVGFWTGDGTTTGNTLLQSLGTNTTFALTAAQVVPFDGGAFYLTGTSSSATKIWRTVDTGGVPSGVVEVTSGSSLRTLSPVGGTLFYIDGNSLRRTDGTPGSTQSVLGSGSQPEGPVVSSAGLAYFSAIPTSRGRELHRAYVHPQAPTIQLTSASPTHVTIQWTSPNGSLLANPVTAFVVERRSNPSDPFVVVGEVGPSVLTFTDSGVDPSGSYTYRVRAANAGGFSKASNEVAVNVAPPKVVDVFVGGSQWGTVFRSFLNGVSGLGEGGMYRVVTGSAEQLNELPWNRIDRVGVQFSRDVNVTQSALVLKGVNVSQYTVSGFAYDPTTRIATWTFATPLDSDKLLVNLDSSAVTSVDTIAGMALDGEFTTSVTNLLTTGSGNGTPGGDFRFRFNVVVGDVDRNGRTLTADRSPILLNLNANAGAANYTVFRDVDGNGRIQTADLSPISLNLNDRLPTAEPVAHNFGAGTASTSPVHFSSTQVVTSNSVGILYSIDSPKKKSDKDLLKKVDDLVLI